MSASASGKKKRAGTSKWIWALNAFHDEPSSQWRAVECLWALRSESGLVVQPASCLAVGQYDPTTRSFPDRWHDLAASAQKSVEQLLSKRTSESIAAPRLLRQETPSVSSAAESLIRFALEEGAEGIVLTSHGRKGPMRLLLGSFAESLLLHSPLPVFVVNPKATRPKGIKTIVFPTDFSAESKVAFGRAVQLAAAKGAKLVLFHKLHTIYPEVGNASPLESSGVTPLVTLEANLRSLGAEWLALAKKAGVSGKLHLDFTPGRILESFLPVVKKQGTDTIVALASTSGRVRATLLGSLARQLMRECPRPVLIFHAEQETLTHKFLTQTTRVALAFGANPPIR